MSLGVNGRGRAQKRHGIKCPAKYYGIHGRGSIRNASLGDMNVVAICSPRGVFFVYASVFVDVLVEI